MKKIVYGKELQEKIEEAINMLVNPVKSTLGPKGSNVIIDHSLFSPFITNDGVTIAENIQSEDEVINTILELAKSASVKTNDNDGTTSTLVILQSLIHEGIKLINKGYNPIILKKELDNICKEIIDLLNKMKIKPTKKDLFNIAKISSNDYLIGKTISDVYNTVKNKNAISIKEVDDLDVKVKYLKGYTIESNLVFNYFLKGEKEVFYNEPYILLSNFKLTSIEDIANIINFIIQKHETLIIIASDFNSNFINDINEINLSGECNIILVNTPEYGINRELILEDLRCISKCSIVNNLDTVTIDFLGKLERVIINDEIITFNFENNDEVKNLLKNLKKKKDEFSLKRVAMLEYGTAEILVGAPTEVERREKKMRFIDALWSINEAKKGILPGSGISLCKIAESQKNTTDVLEMVKISLKKPFIQIMENAALDAKEIYTYIKNNNFEVLYNVGKDKYENLLDTEVYDSLSVVINVITNAFSIAGMLLTTNYLIINEYENISIKNELEE